MNIKKTNPLGLKLIKEGILTSRKFDGIQNTNYNQDQVWIMNLYFLNKEKPKVFRVSKKIIDESKKISFDSIKKNLNDIDTGCSRLAILLDNDKSGYIEYAFVGQDIIFVHVSNTEETVKSYSTFSLLTKNYSAKIHKEENNESDQFPIQLLVYLFYGEITTKIIKPKGKIKINSFSSVLNNTEYNITFVDSNWKQRINYDNPFIVSGHFRLQPFGEGRNKKRIIWIDEFMKKGYYRKSGVENYKEI